MAQLQKKLRSVCLTAKKANFTEVELINENINTVHWVKVGEEDRPNKMKVGEEDRPMKK